MDFSDLSTGQLVRTIVEGPTFHRGALFEVVSYKTSDFVACRAVGIAPFKLWYFQPKELIRAGKFKKNVTSRFPLSMDG
jgi:hypothetical protein